MKIDGVPYRSIWLDEDGWALRIIDQTKLPWTLTILRLATAAEMAEAIRTMRVRGAPLIGAAAAYGLCLGLAGRCLRPTRWSGTPPCSRARSPTAVNLKWALDRMLTRLRNTRPEQRVAVAYAEAAAIADEDVAQNEAIGRHGVELIRARQQARQARQCSDPLQCRLDRDRRLGDGAGAHLHARIMKASTCMSGSMRHARATRAPR